MLKDFVRRSSPVVFALLVASCRDATGPATLAEARSLWQSQNVSTYNYIASHQCFCVFSPDAVRVEVVDGIVFRVTAVATGAEVQTSGYYTIDYLFDWAGRIQPNTLEFDRSFGYPTRIYKCCIENDSGFIYTVSGFSTVWSAG